MNNTPIYHKREELGLVTRPVGGSVADGQVVIATKQVSQQQFVEGMRYFYTVHAVHNTRSLKAVGKYLTEHGITSYTELFSAFADFWLRKRGNDPIADLVERSIKDGLYYDVCNYGLIIHTVLHEHRAVCRLHDGELWDCALLATGLLPLSEHAMVHSARGLNSRIQAGTNSGLRPAAHSRLQGYSVGC